MFVGHCEVDMKQQSGVSIMFWHLALHLGLANPMSWLCKTLCKGQGWILKVGLSCFTSSFLLEIRPKLQTL